MALGFAADGHDRLGSPVERDHAGLVQHDADATLIDKGVGCAEVDGHIATEERTEP